MKELLKVISSGKTSYFIMPCGKPIRTDLGLGRYVRRESQDGQNGIIVDMSQREFDEYLKERRLKEVRRNLGGESDAIEIYALSIRSTHGLLQNVGTPPVDQDSRDFVITQLEGILFRGGTVPLEFRRISDLYIARGLEALPASS
ncbi:MAG: hypothetical protein PHH00_01765 [Candidatus Nanoarchaeia archaeon]|nr:hypothetical protein [Candidatus Nanoarchaeia archaeon]